MLDTFLRTATGGLRIQKGDGTGRFTPSTDFGSLGNTQLLSVVTGDVNADGKIDLVSAVSYVTFRSYGYYGGYDPFVTRLTTVILNQGGGMFSAPQTATLDIEDGLYYTNTKGLQLSDFNRDGRVDLALVDPFSDYLGVAVNDGHWVGIPGISVSDTTTTEANGVTTDAVFTVSLSTAHNSEVRVDFRTVDGSAVSTTDYIAQTGTLIFAPGVTSRTIRVQVYGDLLDEYDESFNVELVNVTGAQLMDATGTAMVLDNDLPPGLSISDLAKPEGSDLNATLFEFILNLSAPSGKDIFLAYELADGTARSIDSDYYATPYGEVYFPAGTTVATIAAHVVADGSIEPNETFFVNLSNPTGTTLTDSQAIGTIVNDDNATNIPNISISDSSIVEGNTGLRIMYLDVTLSFGYSQEIRVDYRTSNGSATTSNNDYVSSLGTLRFAPNVRTQTISVTIRGDKRKEADEWFSVLLTNAVRGVLTDAQGIGTIINDDGSTARNMVGSISQVDAAIAELAFQDLVDENSFNRRLKKRSA